MLEKKTIASKAPLQQSLLLSNLLVGVERNSNQQLIGMFV